MNFVKKLVWIDKTTRRKKIALVFKNTKSLTKEKVIEEKGFKVKKIKRKK